MLLGQDLIGESLGELINIHCSTGFFGALDDAIGQPGY